ncbi:hypothetical protein OIU79_029618 [Salix purpurea]|uniref:Uncharacterized protein n=1 Tax=Salix purpurea TaxID=77065 RepID=A0A9Q0ZVT4_SALPP|nr:hypothetical protein OIU79_029618 [Salix purpurea]
MVSRSYRLLHSFLVPSLLLSQDSIKLVISLFFLSITMVVASYFLVIKPIFMNSCPQQSPFRHPTKIHEMSKITGKLEVDVLPCRA